MIEAVEKLVTELTRDEKCALVAGMDFWHTPPIPRLGIPSLKVSDGPVGARGKEFFGGPPSTCFPCGTALAATWDVALLERVGAALGEELKAKNAHLLLAPTVNIHRHPLAGRNFECYSEDPYLTSRMAVAYITGVQSRGVGATVKHFLCNDSEFERMTISSEVDERTLREIYLPPFEAAVNEAGVWALMSAYNRVNGTYCGEHPGLLNGILRDEWGWDGLVMSDWGGTHSSAQAANAGLDLEMPGPPQHMGDKLARAIEQGEVAEAVVDAMVRRVLTAAYNAGAFEAEERDEASNDSPELRSLVREAAAASMVLLRNELVAGRALLPLDPERIQSLALIGPNADATNIMGGGSAQVTAPYAVSPRDGLIEALPGMTVVHALGCRLTREPLLGRGLVPGGFTVETPSGTTTQSSAAFRWMREVPESARIAATLTPTASGPHTVRIRRTGGRVRLLVGGATVLDSGADSAMGSIAGEIDLEAGREYAMSVEFTPPSAPMVSLEIRGLVPTSDDPLAEAVAAAAAADVAVIVAGMDNEWETEGRDRDDMELPYGQAELIAAVAAANPRTVVVMNAGSPVRMDWADQVPAIVQMWYPGQEAGNALADVLTGRVNPSGRLPTTFPRRLEDTPAFVTYPGEAGQVTYGEGIFVGYRWYEKRRIEPAFPFGHGLSYTTFSYGPLRVSGDGPPFTVAVDVTNDGPRAGAEVVQIYVRDIVASALRPEKELKGFTKLALEPGQSATARVTLDERAFAFWDRAVRRWRVEPGEFEVLAGPSSADIRATVLLPVSD